MGRSVSFWVKMVHDGPLAAGTVCGLRGVAPVSRRLAVKMFLMHRDRVRFSRAERVLVARYLVLEKHAKGSSEIKMG